MKRLIVPILVIASILFQFGCSASSSKKRISGGIVVEQIDKDGKVLYRKMIYDGREVYAEIARRICDLSKWKRIRLQTYSDGELSIHNLTSDFLWTPRYYVDGTELNPLLSKVEQEELKTALKENLLAIIQKGEEEQRYQERKEARKAFLKLMERK